jgi:PAN domain
MRIFIAAVAFAALIGAWFWWRLVSQPVDAPAGARANAVAVPAAPHMGPLEQATNRQGRDLADVGMRVSDAAACSRLCTVDDRCMAMSFVKAADGASGLCWLKGSVPGASENLAVVSAVKIVP